MNILARVAIVFVGLFLATLALGGGFINAVLVPMIWTMPVSYAWAKLEE